MGHALKKVVSLFLVICFLTADLSRAVAQDASGASRVALDPAKFSNIDPDRYTLYPDQLTSEEIAEAKRFLQQPTQYTLEILFLLKNLYYNIQIEEQKLGEEGLLRKIAKRQHTDSGGFEETRIGKAEPIVIHTNRGPLIITKVRHNGLKTVILFFDSKQIDLEFIEESERLLKSKNPSKEKVFEGLTPSQIREELEYRKIITTQLRTLFAKMLMNEWNAKIEYTPLSELVNKPAEEQKAEAPEVTETKVEQVLNNEFSELKKQSWFRRLASQSYDLWVDLADRDKRDRLNDQAKTTIDSLMIVALNSDTNNQTKTIHKPNSIFTFAHWKNYFNDIIAKPSYREDIWKESKGVGKLKVLLTGDYLMGLSFGVGLGGLSFITGLIMGDNLPLGLSAFNVGAISFLWSLTFGVFSKTWKNFVYKGNPVTRFIKNWTTGLGQSYHYNIISEESLFLFDKNRNMDWNAFKTHADILINQSLKSPSKTSHQELWKYTEKTGEAHGKLALPYITMKIPWKHNLKFVEFEATETSIDPLRFYRWLRAQFTTSPYQRSSWEDQAVIRFRKDLKIILPWVNIKQFNTDIDRTSFESQLPQLVTTPVGLLSRFGLGFAVAVDVTSSLTIGFPVPVGHLLYLLLAPIGEVRQINYKRNYIENLARTHGEKNAMVIRGREMVSEELRKWDSLKIFNIPETQFVGYFIKVVPKLALAVIKSVGEWSAKKIAGFSYRIFENIKTHDAVATAEERASREQTDRMRRIMTVQSSSGAPHTRQIRNEIRTQRLSMCARLFQ